jgi:hypothetical protein
MHGFIRVFELIRVGLLHLRTCAVLAYMTRGTLGLLACLALAGPVQAAIIADHLAAAQFDSIPEGVFQDVRDQYRIFFGHTSHGSQVVKGVNMLVEENPTTYASTGFSQISSDLGHLGSLVWEGQTRDWLETHPETNCVIWSWCGGCSDNTVEGIDIYLSAMNELENDYPTVLFVYMTGHLDGTGVDGPLYRNNNQIREFCSVNNKVLYDFADIESWDPGGNYYPDETDACGWCSDWCEIHACPYCDYCAHSHCFNCYLKGKAFWWMMARTLGWDPAEVSRPSLDLLKSYFH